eukprot:scaffold12446_cov82-Cylindrotheca_fusiformis.AAC.1
MVSEIPICYDHPTLYGGCDVSGISRWGQRQNAFGPAVQEHPSPSSWLCYYLCKMVSILAAATIGATAVLLMLSSPVVDVDVVMAVYMCVCGTKSIFPCGVFG